MKQFALAGAIVGFVGVVPAHGANFTGPTVFVAVADNIVDVDASRRGVGSERTSRARAIVNVGYDFRLTSHTIAGVELAGTFGNQETCPASGGRSYCVRMKSEFSALGRAGYVLSPKLLLFAEAGYVSSRARLAYTDAAHPRRNSELSGQLSGLQVGTGVELALSERGYARLNYRYNDFWCGIRESQLIAGVGLRF